ncbi:inosine-uridine nucleoside N-ribohydrolase [Algoriphagus boseongensis]|uniref:Inosine-uridine nucleoside N-ribohydrolase n=1 Tax=Algoriphagus boseongensis TaxID=1442587 RepID=A0A4R6T3A8_9BACT|nr:nucleoside hydrolase [Algoriphagus boseongensis]TDQ16674.1 inosine-uridine nucleoside N-ribohydrolase [Algoriphagus boseongensis]
MILFFLSFYFFSPVFQSISTNTEKDKIPVIIDADTANEVDDLFALARALYSQELDIIGITSAQFHISPLATDSTVKESQLINEQLIQLTERKGISLPIGSNFPLKSASEPQRSPASDFIIQEALKMRGKEKLNLVILGSCTNVASAIIQEPRIIPKIKVHYLGIWHDPTTNTFDKKEFNSGNDTIAVNVLFDTPNLDLTIMSATTSQHLVFEKTKVDQELKGKSELGDFLVNRWETYTRWWTKEDPEKARWIMWDVAIIEALIHPEWTKTEEFWTPKENTRRKVKIHTGIQNQEMENDFWEAISKSKSSN